MTDTLAHRLLSWYAQHARRLPWRDHPDPYAVWVSEIMLQQTRVETVQPYFARWMQRFPTIADLASADLHAVLNIWEGLGYYSRARNLHAAARQVVARHSGVLPADLAALRKLPGIGRYTAGALASIAFGLDEPALDGNIRRVLARVFDVTLPENSPPGQAALWRLAAEHLPAGRAGDYNQALMDLGATVCTPRQPRCADCPLSTICAANRLGLQTQRPVRRAKPQTPHYTVTAAVIQRAGQVFIAQRPLDGLLGGLWEFPGGKLQPDETLPDGLRREIREELAVEVAVGQPLGVYRHAFTHFRITLHAFDCTLADETSEPQPLEHASLAWVPPHQLSTYPMGKVDRQIARHLLGVNA